MKRIMHGYMLKTHHVMKQTGIHPGQAELLRFLKDNNGLSQKDIANEFNIKPPTVAVMIKRMVKNGMVTTKKDENDQRVTRVYYTQKGMEAYTKFDALEDEFENKVKHVLTEEELTTLFDLLDKISKADDKSYYEKEDSLTKGMK